MYNRAVGGDHFEAMLELGKEVAEGRDGIEMGSSRTLGEQPNYTLERLITVLMWGLFTYFTANPPGRGWQRNEGLLLLHSFQSLDILVAFSILRFGTSAKSVS